MAAIPNRYDVSVVVRAGAEQVRAVVGTYGNVEQLPGDEGSRLRMSVDDLSWPVMALGVMGAPFTVEQPPELRDQLRATGEALLRGAA